MRMTAPRAVVALAAALTLAGSAVALATPTLSGTTLNLAAGDSASVICAGPSLSWSVSSATTGVLQCAANPVTTTTAPPTTTTTTVPPTTTTTTAPPSTTTTVPVTPAW